MSGNEYIIETTDLSKSYGPHMALEKLNLKVNKGATGLLGPNGAGKSTFLKTILGLIQATSGDGTVLGHDIRTEGAAIRSRIGYMPEYDALNPDMEAIYQVKYSGELLGMNPVIAMARAHEVLQYVGLGEQRYRNIGSFSTGMKQATKLACSIIHDPELIIADEPSNGLDSTAREFMISTLQNMVNNGNRSVMMASHLMDDVERVCDHMVLLHKGKLAAQGKIEDLKDIDREIEIHVWGNASKLEEKMTSIGLEVRREGRIMRILHEDEDTTSKILSCAAEVGSQIRRMHEYEASLEDLFIVIMENLGYEVKTSQDLLRSPVQARQVDAPSHMGGGS
ncbi:MAG: ABC transporter ATP-binding protein [Candidatus Thermoplasmatota archaeon]|nr:ABC transporter ATP-binding protein [Candidatus Thermoplasmatota archaeon]DAC52572.1 MAG TPA: ABC transporter ATP-binding protein [Candidatus Poseidoniales archaeon]DAC59694.1 MAG TPA: ABC transporter ATP-binding protein [Candidatus Poseidoniales archaeon]HII23597.1 ABC transporter ATP-binding protein [Candidatus Poseidoniaceae archaeon]HII50409.1 ABC transporter ATP-binding protein [Candidatus Poseidoniaceae archaeon]|tara:strand:+ start:3018 stop:4028 length:1011 start_codon:yes stop_codon:yes gene_type:complete